MKALVWIVGIIVLAVVLVAVVAFQAWLVGIVLGIFDISITRGQSIAVVVLFDMLFNVPRALDSYNDRGR